MKTPTLPNTLHVRSVRAPRCRNGVSSLLRLSQPAAARLPAPQAVSGWAARAAGLLSGPEFTVGRLAAAR